jgi:hypothetical protein
VWQRQFPANENWQCGAGCPLEKDQVAQIFGMIRHALYTDNREVYLNFDNSWIDKVLDTKAKVNVVGVSRDQLGGFIANDYSSPDYERDETFQIIFSLPSGSGPYRPLSFAEGEIIDNFLTKNPCWMPIHDPPVALPGESPEVTAHHLGTFDYTAIFIRLPAFWLHSTCKLFTLITRKQFPEKCPEASNVKAYWTGNIGWANCVHPIQEHLRDSLLSGKLLINPRAYDSGSFYQKEVNGKNMTLVPWRWASQKECDPEIYAFNPWHCHFISITSCNTPELQTGVPFQDNWQYTQQDRDAWPKSDYFLSLVSGVGPLLSM